MPTRVLLDSNVFLFGFERRRSACGTNFLGQKNGVQPDRGANVVYHIARSDELEQEFDCVSLLCSCGLQESEGGRRVASESRFEGADL